MYLPKFKKKGFPNICADANILVGLQFFLFSSSVPKTSLFFVYRTVLIHALDGAFKNLVKTIFEDGT